MSNPIFAADALAITSSKSANFPLSFEIIKDNHQNAYKRRGKSYKHLAKRLMITMRLMAS
jgi:hypothetical protein